MKYASCCFSAMRQDAGPEICSQSLTVVGHKAARAAASHGEDGGPGSRPCLPGAGAYGGVLRRARNIVRVVSGLLLLFVARPLASQPTPVPKHEFRGAWIATVANLDWPVRTDTPDQQKALLVHMLDALEDAGINAVFFQVRSECDAMYDSQLEPWSYWLTGEQGRPPDPWYDPLAFAIEEAHKRGLELHAWFNPYRARRGTATYMPSSRHVARTRPEWLLEFGNLLMLDPGRAAVRDYVTNVVMDVVRRYDIDGVHMDDYFYPYPPDEIGTEDSVTFAEESRGFSNLSEWRRDNVNTLVAQLADSIRAAKPSIKFGISPFGIWRDGVPLGIRGMDAYESIYADPLAWIDAGSVDYLIPQLYWPFGGAQDYGKLAPWWSYHVQNRHLYIGQALHRTESRSFSGTPFTPEEIPAQIRLNRRTENILGNVFFRARNITHFSSHGIVQRLETDFYRHPALTPPMAWKAASEPGIPENLKAHWTADGDLALSWEPGSGASRYAVYRTVSEGPPDVDAASRQAQNLLAVTGETAWTDQPGLASDPYYYFVRSVGDNSLESGPSRTVSVLGRDAAANVESLPALAVATSRDPYLDAAARITLSLDETAIISLRIYGKLGQLERTLADGKMLGPGSYSYTWDGTDDEGVRLDRSVYTVMLAAGSRPLAKPVTLLR